MAAKKGGLGKGMSALIYDNAMEPASGESVRLSINEIEPNRDQPRKIFEEQAYGVIEDSIGSTITKQWAEGSLKAPIGDKHFGLILLAALGSVSSGVHAGESIVYDHIFSVQQGAQHQALSLFSHPPKGH